MNRLVAPLRPLAQQWDPLSETWCWMAILRGPIKLDFIFAEPHEREPPWDQLRAISTRSTLTSGTGRCGFARRKLVERPTRFETSWGRSTSTFSIRWACSPHRTRLMRRSRAIWPRSTDSKARSACRCRESFDARLRAHSTPSNSAHGHATSVDRCKHLTRTRRCGATGRPSIRSPAAVPSSTASVRRHPRAQPQTRSPRTTARRARALARLLLRSRSGYGSPPRGGGDRAEVSRPRCAIQR